MTDHAAAFRLVNIVVVIVFVIAFAAGVIILSFGLTRMFGVRKRPDRTATLSVRLASHYDGVSTLP